jgi:hypothetical protein
MTPEFDTLFPDGIPDSCARALVDFLYRLALIAEQRYEHELRRDYDKRYREMIDPDQPWHRKTDPLI